MTTRREFFDIDLEAALSKAESAIGISRDKFSYILIKEIFGRPQQKPKTGIIVEFKEEDKKSKEENKKNEENWQDDLPQSESSPIEKASYVLEGIFKRMGYKVLVTPVEKNGQVILTVKMPDQKFDLNKGESREFRGAVQCIINRVFSSGSEGELRLIVDIGGTLEERSRQLRKLADETSVKVKSIGKPINIHLMNSQDRRILHLALENNQFVCTSSFGDDRFRIIKIQPKTGS